MRISVISGYWSLYVVRTFYRYSSYLRKWDTLLWYLFWFFVSSSISFSRSIFSNFFTFNLLFFLMICSLLETGSFFGFFLLHLVFLWKLAKLSHLLLELLILNFYFLLLFLKSNLFLSELFFLSLKGFMNFVHLPSLL